MKSTVALRAVRAAGRSAALGAYIAWREQLGSASDADLTDQCISLGPQPPVSREIHDALAWMFPASLRTKGALSAS
jgi:hypothetical protein